MCEINSSLCTFSYAFPTLVREEKGYKCLISGRAVLWETESIAMRVRGQGQHFWLCAGLPGRAVLLPLCEVGNVPSC